MGRLLPQALYSNELTGLHAERARGVAVHLGCFGEEPASFEGNDDWLILAENAEALDSDGNRSYAMLKLMESEEAQRRHKMESHSMRSLTLAQEIAAKVL